MKRVYRLSRLWKPTSHIPINRQNAAMLRRVPIFRIERFSYSFGFHLGVLLEHNHSTSVFWRAPQVFMNCMCYPVDHFIDIMGFKPGDRSLRYTV